MSAIICLSLFNAYTNLVLLCVMSIPIEKLEIGGKVNVSMLCYPAFEMLIQS